MITLVMCAGENKRWLAYKPENCPEYKQLTRVYGKRLIDRITDSLNARSIQHFIIAADDKLIRLIDKPNSIIKIPQQSSLCGSIMAAKHLWSFPLTILLGDVLYDPIDLNEIYTEQKFSTAFFGGVDETYAVVFKKDPTSLLSYTTRYLCFDRRSGRMNKARLCELRYFHRYGQLPPKHKFKERNCRLTDPAFTFVRGWTRDIDHKMNLSNALRNPRIKNYFLKGGTGTQIEGEKAKS